MRMVYAKRGVAVTVFRTCISDKNGTIGHGCPVFAGLCRGAVKLRMTQTPLGMPVGHSDEDGLSALSDAPVLRKMGHLVRVHVAGFVTAPKYDVIRKR